MEAKEYITTFFGDLATILGEMAPYLLLGFFFAGLLYAFIPRRKIEKYFSGKPLKSSVLASLFGIPLPLCSCGVIPTGTALFKNGASRGGTVSFLISTPQTGVDSILATFSLLGLPFAIIRPIAALITGITGGLITSRYTSNEEKNREIPIENYEPSGKSIVSRIKEAFNYGFVEFIQDISKWLVIGLVVAAIISALIPDDFFNVLALPPILQMLMILVISVPLYICATGTIPLAAVLLLKGISPGAAFVLLMAGPATNAATITMIGKVMGKKSLFTYLSTIIIGALSFGLLIDYVFPVHWFTGAIDQHLAHNHGEQLAWWKIVSGITLVSLIINGYIQKRLREKRESGPTIKNNNTRFNTIKVEGMTCNHCKSNIESNLEKLNSIKSAKVNLNEKTVLIEGDDVDMSDAIATIELLGYKTNRNDA